MTISARATQDLSSFNLDLRGFKVSSVTVNGSAASFTRKGQEMTITPAAGLRRNRDFTVRVVYAGHANYVLDPDKSKDGWIPTDDGAFVVNEPQGSPTWFPANDTPKDFATYDFAITVPEGRTALANGMLVSTTDNGDTTTWRWREDRADGDLPHHRDERLLRAAHGTIARRARVQRRRPEDAPLRPEGPRAGAGLVSGSRVQPEALEFLINLYGPYPFDSVGAIVDWAPNVFYSLESQTKPNYWHVPSELTIVHELAHKWFGDAVVLERWPDMWLNEGFATWSEWIWTERGLTARARRSSSTTSTRPPRTPPPARTSGSRRRTTSRRVRAVPHAGLRPRRDDAPGAAREGRRETSSSRSSAAGTPRTATRT